MKNKRGDFSDFFYILFALFGLILLVIFVALAVTAIVGLHWEISNGEHTGYITAVETNGLIFKTDSIYIKSDVASTQEDRYCILDKKIKEQLKQKAINKEKVTLVYIDWFNYGWKYCKINDAAVVVGLK
jgi:C4-type Zn-finger protein